MKNHLKHGTKNLQESLFFFPFAFTLFDSLREKEGTTFLMNMHQPLKQYLIPYPSP
jgi:hypothetical protein